ncbi:MAG TPA: hypothetical protein DGG95_09855 [Cytophagales bacterium]|jgi:hypothetical protein|nr:hypothetical protein [Cytophagales bacterium]
MKIFIILLLPFLFGSADNYFIESLEPNAKVLINGKFEPFRNQSVDALYLSIDLIKNQKKELWLSNTSELYLFFNSKLIGKAKNFVLVADSLVKLYPQPVLVCLYSPKGIEHIKASWAAHYPPDLLENPLRPKDGFNNFVVLSSILLLSFFTLLLRTNPQLTLDYLNIVKLFSFRRRDETQFTLRVTSSVNLLFYLFSSLLVSLAVMICFRHSADLFILKTKDESFSNYFLQWLVGGFFSLVFLLVKFLLLVVFSKLFLWKDVVGFQFFNFVRALVVTLALLGFISLLLGSLSFTADYYLIIKLFFAVLCIEPILIFFKLMTRDSVRPFHLFSYLCATEIFPLLFLIKFFLF